MTKLKIVFVSHTAADSPFRVGSHHLARELAKFGHDVWHVSTPRSMRQTIGKRTGRHGEEIHVQEGVTHWTPRTVLPIRYHESASSLARQFRRRGLEHADVVLVDQPLMSFVSSFYSENVLIYRPTDICGTAVLRQRQEKILARADAVLATSTTVLGELAVPDGLPTLVVPNGVEIDRFAQGSNGRALVRAGFVYVGSLSARFDWTAIQILAGEFPDERIDIFGPPVTLPEAPLPDNVGIMGPLDYERLPSVLRSYRVGLLPLSDADVNRGRSPMKFYEYSASGLAVLCRRVPSLVDNFGLDREAHVYGYSDHRDLVGEARRAISHGVPDTRAIDLAAENSWSKKAAEVEGFINQVERTSVRLDQDQEESRRRARVAVVTETPEDGSAPGKNRRFESLSKWLLNDPSVSSIENWAVQREEGSGHLKRLWNAWRWRAAERATGLNIVVSALSAPHMILVAHRLAKKNTVVLDVCDSWILQHRSRREQGGAARLFPIVGILAMKFGRRIHAVTYISPRDVKSDARWIKGRKVGVVRQSRPRSLETLEPLQFPVDRIVVPVDVTAFHNQRGVREYLPAIAAWARKTGFRVDVYGRVPSELIPPGLNVIGWVEDLQDVYRGNSVVFVTNVGGSGVPNKVVEAEAAGRPVILHESLSYLQGDIRVAAYWFSGIGDIAKVLSECVSSSAAPASRGGPQVREWPEPTPNDLFGRH